ncbi:MAG: hypothetical protein EHM72_15325 [Calditrichaeota bacterium]|nr:MAG: hypothetical protein EHM72_15325 [Calditrichota bacterium]
MNATPFGGFYDYIERFEKSPGSQMNLFDQDIYHYRVVVKEIVSWEIVLYFNKMSVECRFIFDLAFNTESGNLIVRWNMLYLNVVTVTPNKSECQ